MSLERVIKALVRLGLTRSDAEVYVYIAKKGPQTVVDLARALSCDKHKIYPCIEHLQTKRLVTLKDRLFSALPFEEALELLITLQKSQTQRLQVTKKELLVSWKKDY